MLCMDAKTNPFKKKHKQKEMESDQTDTNTIGISLFFFLFNLWMRFAKCKGHHSNDILLATHKNQWWWPNAMLIGFLNANERIDILETKLKGLELNCPRKEYGIQKFCISYRCRATIGLQQNEKFKFEL